jgi:uroporphyrin-III C-methyltransferase / precorrin-2 dehydrogenase / sirohydrochlorin ferrochelatase
MSSSAAASPEGSLYPAFLKLAGRRVLLVGGGQVAAGKLGALLEAGAQVTLVAPVVRPELERPEVTLQRRAFDPSDLEGIWFCVSAAPGPINRQVAEAAEGRCLFVNAVDDPGAGSVFLGGVVRKGGATLAISTQGAAPALAGLLREALDALLPEDLDQWVTLAKSLRGDWKARAVAMAERRPLLLQALNRLYDPERAP